RRSRWRAGILRRSTRTGYVAAPSWRVDASEVTCVHSGWVAAATVPNSAIDSRSSIVLMNADWFIKRTSPFGRVNLRLLFRVTDVFEAFPGWGSILANPE